MTTDHVNHARVCGCLVGSAECCRANCGCHKSRVGRSPLPDADRAVRRFEARAGLLNACGRGDAPGVVVRVLAYLLDDPDVSAAVESYLIRKGLA